MKPELLKAESQHFARGLGAVSVAPERNADPIAELRAIVLGVSGKTDTPAQALTLS